MTTARLAVPGRLWADVPQPALPLLPPPRLRAAAALWYCASASSPAAQSATAVVPTHSHSICACGGGREARRGEGGD